MHCWELLQHDGAFGCDGRLLHRTIFTDLCLSVHKLPSWSVSNERRVDRLFELPYGNLPRHNGRVVISVLRGVPRWELLRNHWALGGYSHLRRWEILVGLGLFLHELPNRSVSSKRRLDELHELPHRHFSRHDWRVVFCGLCGVHIRELLRHDGTLGSHGIMRRWAIFGGFGLVLHELLSWSVSNERRLDRLLELPHRRIPRRDWRGILRIMYCWEFLRHGGTFRAIGGMRRWSIFGGLGFCLHRLSSGPISS